ncbi:hypothetical protein CCMSSC00406_0003338 [Pleurotus cornucopiae]|uniref:Uncharacterized protein n=1 Tax=Pleurotus cornucopiae TaxID=5321 RepID=A0ACB7J8S8_PLECO|nr:hypothetical protein CCMSSC00406_0003338 [Pleurotus cornucopiae]
MSFSTIRPIATQPYDRQRRPALLGRDTSEEVGGPSMWAGALDPAPPADTPTDTQTQPEQGNGDLLAAMRQMMTDMEQRMEARIQQALVQPSRPASVASRSSRALPRLPRGIPFPPPPPGPPTPPPPPAPLVELPPAPQARNYGPKMARPEVFDGERAKCRRFIRNIEVYIFINAYQFPNEATKVLYLLSYVQGKKGKLQPNPIPSEPWTDISADFIVKLPRSAGHDAILVVVDRFTKMVRLVPTTEELSALGLAKLYRDHVWKIHGLPNSIISDRGPQFASQVMRELNTLLGIQTKLSTAFHPQTDGQTERANREIETYLRMFINHRQDDWAEWLAICEFSLNNKNQTSSRQSPFYLNYGRHPRMGVEPRKESKVEAVDNFARRMKQTWEEARSALVKAGEEMKKYADRRVGDVPNYQVGDKAFIFTDNLNTTRPSQKLEQKKIGPYEVVGVPTKNAVTLKIPKSLQIHPTISTHRTEKANQPTIPGQQVSPPPTSAEERAAGIFSQMEGLHPRA